MSSLILTGVIDGSLSGGLPKAIQLYAAEDIADLSAFGLGSANNGNGGGVEEFTFPSVAVAAGTTIYVASEEEGFTTFFGFAPTYTSGVAIINGDDAIELFRDGARVDVFGDVDVDGTGQPWEYLDGWAYRAPEDGPSATFASGDWTYSGPNALDGAATNASADAPFPMPGGGGGTGPAPVSINEYRISAPGGGEVPDFVELKTDPGASLEGLTLLAVSGEFAPGQIDFAIDLSDAVADADGLVLIADASNGALGDGDVPVEGLNFFSSPQSFLVVEGFTGAAGDDIDADDDGTIEAAPWTGVVAGLSLEDGDDRADVNYADAVIPATGFFTPAAAARGEDGSFAVLPFGDQSGDTPGAPNGGPDDDAPRVTIMEIQGGGHVSGLVSDTPLDPTTGDGSGARVTTGGIVTAVDSNGFYLQDAEGDGDLATSDALFVFTGGAPAVAIGDALDVTGTVSEFYPGGQGTGNLSTTQLGGNPEITVLSSGNALPEAVVLGQGGRVLPTEVIEDDQFASFDPETDGIDFWESLEGMLVVASQPVAVSGTSGFGELFTVLDGGVGATGLSERGTLNISPDDFNPEKVQIDWDFGIEPVEVDTGAKLADVTGVVSYDFGYYQINPTEQIVVIEDSPLAPESTDLAGSADQLSVASYNVLNLDPVVEVQANTNGGQSRNVDDDIGDGRFAAIAEQIVGNLGSPDILGLQEIQDNTGGEIGDGVVSASLTFETLIDAIDLADDGEMNDSSGYAFIDNTFIEDQASGGQPGGNIRTGFLYKTDRVSVVEGSVGTIGSQDPGAAFEGARLPLVADFAFNGETVTVVNNHFSSKGGSAPILGVEQSFTERQEDVEVNGSLDERQAQASAVAGFVEGVLAEDADANVVVLGDFNEFEFVSPLEILEGAGLTNLTNTLPEDERYSFTFQGNSQSLDHILVSDALAGGAQFDVVHVNSEFADTDGRASDHDPLVALLTVGEVEAGPVQVAVALTPTAPLGVTAAQTVNGRTVADGSPGLLQRDDFVFEEVGVSVAARAPGFEFLSTLGGDLGIFSRGDDGLLEDGTLVNDRESLLFRLEGEAFGDAVEATFDFGDVEGSGRVRAVFFDEGERLGSRIFDATDGSATTALRGAEFDAVRLHGLGDTAFSLDGFGFERLPVTDDLLVS